MTSLPLSVVRGQVCNNEGTCTCDTTWAGTDCSMPDPPKEPDILPEVKTGKVEPTEQLTGDQKVSFWRQVQC